MDSQNKAKKLYVLTVIIFVVIVVAGQVLNLWRDADYKFLLLLFLIISIAFRLDEIYTELVAGKTKSSDMYLLDTRLQNIIELLENMNRGMENPDKPYRENSSDDTENA